MAIIVKHRLINECLDYNPRTTLNGNISTAPMNLKTSSSVSPTIRNGSNTSHTIGKMKISTRAIGQQSTNKMHQRITTRSVFMKKFL